MIGNLERSIVKTVAWFSLFETPVTVFEIWKWILEPEREYALEEVYAALEGEGVRERLVGTDGFWTLRGMGGSATPTERRERFLDAARKYAKLRRAARYFALIPSIQSVSAANTLAWWNTRADSDIDLYITVRPGTIWMTRLLAVAPFALLGKRPGATELDPFCFSFFVTSDAPALSTFALPGGDPYLDLWIRSLVPVFACGSPDRSVRRHGAFRLFEPLARKLQMRRLPMRIKRSMNVDSRVVVTDQALKFHENDRREEYRDRWRQMITGI